MSSKPAASLRIQLLCWVLLPLLAVLSINAWLSHRVAAATADLAFDRLLRASAEAIAEDVEIRAGEVVVDLPYAALELLESNLQERIFYRVVGTAGTTLTGYDDLPLPAANARGDAEAASYSARYRGEPIHLVAITKKLYGAEAAAPVTVIVAETSEARVALSSQMLVEGLQRQALLIAAAGLLIWLGLVRGLAPLEHLRRSVAQRELSDLSPIDGAGVQHELRPLISALNEHMARIQRLLSGRRQWITDASHQLRTPLAEMRMQIEYSLAQSCPRLDRRTLGDVRQDIQNMARLLAQLLLQARCDPEGLAAPGLSPVDLNGLARQTALDHVAAARAREIDLAFEAAAQPALVMGSALLLRELLANLLDNAIRYGRPSGHVTVRVRAGQNVAFDVEDDGPGIAVDERERVFERFYRSPTVEQGPPGSGLGLSIVRDIATAHGATVELHSAIGGTGLRVHVELPSMTHDAQAAGAT